MDGGPRLLSFQELDARAAAYDGHVARTPGIDLFCSSTDWILPARESFAPSAEPFIVETDAGFVSLMTVPTAEGARALAPLEPIWGLASPFVGPDPAPLAAALFETLGQRGGVHALFLSGLAVGGDAAAAVARFAGPRWRAIPGPEAGRQVADLVGGVDGFYSRRSPHFRANLRRERRMAAREGVTYEYHTRFPTPAEVSATYQRIQDIERTSWKGIDGHGIDQGPAFEFYRQMLLRLAARGALRVVFARLGDDDVAYVFGGLFRHTYRGLQCSFDDRWRRLSPGALVHMEMIERLCDEGVAVYDLGSDMEYKKRWGEDGLLTSATIVIRRR